MNWKQERLFVFFIGGLHRNSDPNKKYFYDREDKTFFVLSWENGKYKINDNIPKFQTDEVRQNLIDKISKLYNNNNDILEIRNLDNPIKINYDIPERSVEVINQLSQLEKQQYLTTKDFIEANNIDLEQSHIMGEF